MRYNLSLPQKGIIDAGLHDLPIQPALLLDFLRGFYFSRTIEKRIIGEKEFAWMHLDYVASELPLLMPGPQIESSTSEKEADRIKRSKIEKLSRWIACLKNFKLIDTRRANGNRLYFRLTELSADILGMDTPASVAENRNSLLRKTATHDGAGNIEDHSTKITPPINGGDESDFEAFWKAYPKKVKKPNAARAWKAHRKVRPPIAQLLSSLKAATSSYDWQKQGGQFIPNPATWLNDHQWNDFSPSHADESDESEEIQEPSGDWHAALMKHAAPGVYFPDNWQQLPDHHKRYAIEFLRDEIRSAPKCRAA